jgi:hypothetical protein
LISKLKRNQPAKRERIFAASFTEGEATLPPRWFRPGNKLEAGLANEVDKFEDHRAGVPSFARFLRKGWALSPSRVIFGSRDKCQGTTLVVPKKRRRRLFPLCRRPARSRSEARIIANNKEILQSLLRVSLSPW